jgi:hypothetical protein
VRGCVYKAANAVAMWMLRSSHIQQAVNEQAITLFIHICNIEDALLWIIELSNLSKSNSSGITQSIHVIVGGAELCTAFVCTQDIDSKSAVRFNYLQPTLNLKLLFTLS